MNEVWCIEMVWTCNEKGENEFIMRVYEGKTEGGGVKGRSPVKWVNRVWEYWSRRVGSSRIECAEMECQNWERWRRFCCRHPIP